MKNKNTRSSPLTELEFIDLDLEEDSIHTLDHNINQNVNYDFENEAQEKNKFSRHIANFSNTTNHIYEKYLIRINWHIVLAVVVVISLILIVQMLRHWGNRVESDFDANNMSTEFQLDVLDSLFPVINDGEKGVDDGITTVITLGNAPFADDYNSSTNVANMIAELSGATVYNCAVANSYLAATNDTFRPYGDPMDAFNFYWLATLMALNNTEIYPPAFESFQLSGIEPPADAVAAYETLSTIDYNTVDAIIIMYDGSDYLAGRNAVVEGNHTDIQGFSGNLIAGIELLKSKFPHIRIIIMSPTYAFAVNEDGEYVSSDLYIYKEHPLSQYVQLQEYAAYSNMITFIDNFYGTVNELNAKDYLVDNIHLNEAGRRLVAERCVYALQYYDKK